MSSPPTRCRQTSTDSPGGSRVRDEAGSSDGNSAQKPWRIEPDGSLADLDRDAATGTPPARLHHADGNSFLRQQEVLINSYEAEEERIMNTLMRKLEEAREEKIGLERTHEEESEAHVNRLARELVALRMQAQPQTTTGGVTGVQTNGVNATSHSNPLSGITSYTANANASDPSTDILLAALRKENDTLRSRLVSTERDYVRVTRLNEVYREELIEHRRRLGLSVDNLIGLSSSVDPLSQPIHRRPSSTTSSSPTASMVSLSRPPPTTHSMPIPRQAQTRRAHASVSSIPETPLSHSPSSASASDSPYISPVLSALPESYASAATQLTTPPSSASLQSNPPALYPLAPPPLSYPSVPPPSLSSSLGSPVVMTHVIPGAPPSPVAPLSRRGSHSQQYGGGGGGGGGAERRVVETGSNATMMTRSRRASMERGARIAETGTLVRSRASSGASGAPGPVPTQPDLGVFASVEEMDEAALE